MDELNMHTVSEKLAKVNFTEAGRMASMVGGGALAVYGLATGIKNKSMPSLALAVLGGGMIYKAASEKRNSSQAASDHLPYRGGVVIEKSVTIAKPASELFTFWHNFENLSCFMEHLISVKQVDDRISHWVAKGPAGIPIEWDAEVINEIPGEMIAWRSLETANIDNTGSVHFKPQDDGSTLVKVVIRYDPPGRHVGAALARLFGEEPGLQVDEDLHRFKQLMETGEVSANAQKPLVTTGAHDMEWPNGDNPVKDDVNEASKDSFPASDPPSTY
ncbi:MAG TPA: SRPBCC family protein [Capsulimonadaceae bacterium]